jgi:hypothetical protein
MGGVHSRHIEAVEGMRRFPLFDRLRPWHVVLLAHLVFLALTLAKAGGDPMTFVRLAHAPGQGYDGQFTYLIATDPSPPAVIHEIGDIRQDSPAYRYQRILLPMTARALSLGNSQALPWILPLLNLVALAIGTTLVARLLDALGASPWHAVVYGLWPGLVIAVAGDLPEPVSMAFVAGAYLGHAKGREWISAACFGLALFSKESAILFVVAQAVFAASERRWRTLVPLVSAAIVPFAIWQAVLVHWFGAAGFGVAGYGATPLQVLPFKSAWELATGPTAFAAFLIVLVPAVIFPSAWGIAAAVRAIVRRDWNPYVWALGANAGLLPFTPYSTFSQPWAMIRLCTGLVLATLLFAASTKRTETLRNSWFWLVLLVLLRL